MYSSSGKIRAYFSHLISWLGSNKDIHFVVVAHMVPNTVYFLPAIDSLATLGIMLPKPKSRNREEYHRLSSIYKTYPLDREWAANPVQVVAEMDRQGLSGKDVVFIDIGGYFSETINQISHLFSGNIMGLMDGTENGAARYEQNLPFSIPIITVARSPLKLPEDYLVASSIVFSVEAVIRDQSEILQTRTAAVIGYGRVGSSVASILRGRGINTVVYDIDPIKLAEAAARGFQANTKLEDALRASSLVICATGNKSLGLRGFGMLESGSIVASVTSADDEFDLASLSSGYIQSNVNANLARYDEDRDGERHFFLVANGNAANFIHGAIIGPAIQLIEGEKLAAVKALIDRKIPPAQERLSELDSEARRGVAEIWIEHFL